MSAAAFRRAACRLPSAAASVPRRALATEAGARPGLGHGAPVYESSEGVNDVSGPAIPLSNVEAQWENLDKAERYKVRRQLEKLQEKDWKELSFDEKKAAYYVAFGPHGPRKPINPPGTSIKVAFGVATLIGLSGATYFAVRASAPPPPRTITKEWEDAALERAREMKINPIHGVSSEGYKGNGFSTHK